jgi:hypothetical protein
MNRPRKHTEPLAPGLAEHDRFLSLAEPPRGPTRFELRTSLPTTIEWSPAYSKSGADEAFRGSPAEVAISIAVTFLVASLICFLVFVFCEVPLLGVVPVMRFVILAFTHTLLVPFVFRIILVFVFRRILVAILD